MARLTSSTQTASAIPSGTAPSAALSLLIAGGNEMASSSQQLQTQDAQSQRDERLANGLGWFSIGLGLAEVIAPGALAQLIGVPETDNSRKVLRAYGLREI